MTRFRRKNQGFRQETKTWATHIAYNPVASLYMIDDITFGKYQLHTSIFILKLGTKYGNQIHMGKLTKIFIHIINVHMKFFIMI